MNSRPTQIQSAKICPNFHWGGVWWRSRHSWNTWVGILKEFLAKSFIKGHIELPARVVMKPIFHAIHCDWSIDIIIEILFKYYTFRFLLFWQTQSYIYFNKRGPCFSLKSRKVCNQDSSRLYFRNRTKWTLLKGYFLTLSPLGSKSKHELVIMTFNFQIEID